MNIRRKVKLSFVVIVLMLVFLGLVSTVITYQVKENSNFRAKVSHIVILQEGMNDILVESIKINDLEKLEKLKIEFAQYENDFEVLRRELSQIKKLTLANLVIENLRQDKMVKHYLEEFYTNEHTIELIYDEIFQREREKLQNIHVFDTFYPEENKLRIVIQTKILESNNVEQIKELGNLRYHSKELLYQKSENEILEKWLSNIERLIVLATQAKQEELKNTLIDYRVVAQNIGEKAMRIETIRKIENESILRVSNILDSNKALSMALEKNISQSSNTFVDKMRLIQLLVGISVVLLIIILAFKVSRNVSLTMDEVEAKIEEGLVEVNALNAEIEDTQREIIFTMGAIGERRSKETGNHVKRVAEYCKILALHYGLDEQESEMLKLASPMHDIGKIAIPDTVLNKPGRFDEEERRIMDTHSMMGYEMLKHSTRPLLKMAAIVAKEHHEKYDGTGYPDNKIGEDIHIYGRITALADVFDALGSARVYKPAWDDEKIFALFKEERGKHFDPRLVDIFFEHLGEFLHIRNNMKD